MSERDKRRPLLTLCMIVKDEAHTILDTLESCVGIVDRAVIVDTGSKDKTVSILEEWEKFDVLWFSYPFVDYSTSRNRCLDLHREAAHNSEFTLMLSADETLKDGGKLKEFLEAHRNDKDGAYSVTMESAGQVWTYPRILRTDSKWEYQNPVQEVPVGSAGEKIGPLCPGRIVHAATDPERRLKRIKEVDFPLLTKIVEDESKSFSERAHAMFFLAETYNVLAVDAMKNEKGEIVRGGKWLTYEFIAMSLYLRYTQIAEDPDLPAHDMHKALLSWFRFLNTAEKIDLFGHDELIARANAIITVYPEFPEPHYVVAVHAAQLDAKKGLYLSEKAAKVAREAKSKPTYLPTDASIEWKALRIAAECAKVISAPQVAKDLAKRGIDAGGPPEAFEGLLV